MASLKDAEEKLKDASSERSEAETTHQSLIIEKSECLTIQEDNLRPMKEGSGKRQNLSPLKTLFKKLCSDASMLNALPLALGRKPADRGQFDVMVVEYLEGTIAKHIASLGEKID